MGNRFLDVNHMQLMLKEMGNLQEKTKKEKQLLEQILNLEIVRNIANHKKQKLLSQRKLKHLLAVKNLLKK